MNEQNTDIRFNANREVRVIPKGWQHPKDTHGKHIPLLPADYEFEDDEHRASCRGLMPEIQGEAEIAAYETTTEGTPISQAFPNTPAGKLALVRCRCDPPRLGWLARTRRLLQAGDRRWCHRAVDVRGLGARVQRAAADSVLECN